MLIDPVGKKVKVDNRIMINSNDHSLRIASIGPVSTSASSATASPSSVVKIASAVIDNSELNNCLIQSSPSISTNSLTVHS